MKLLKIKNQSRRDFTGVYKCEGCGHEETLSGCYDDRNFHDNVMPDKKCSACKKSTKDLGVPVERVETKYSDNQLV